MGHKVFVSYKYGDWNVKKITKNYQEDTVRDYVDALENYINSNSDHVYKGESDGEDLSSLSEESIWNLLKNRIYDSTLTIVMISRNMKETKKEREQWIPWEISYSLKEVSRKNKAGNMVTSSTNAILAIVIPDKDGSYSYYINDKACCSSGCRLFKTDTLFKILKDNMFNIKKPDKEICGNNSTIYHGDCSYIISVKWEEFINDPERYIDKAYYLQNSIEKYEIVKDIDNNV